MCIFMYICMNAKSSGKGCQWILSALKPTLDEAVERFVLGGTGADSCSFFVVCVK